MRHIKFVLIMKPCYHKYLQKQKTKLISQEYILIQK